MFDAALLWLFDLPVKGEEHLLPLWMGMVYVILSLAAVRYRLMFYAVSGSALGYAGYVFLL